MTDSETIAIDVTPDKDGGILKQILTEGHGFERPSAGNEVEVHYTGRLVDGTVFDSSVTRGEKFKFKLGQGSVIRGWDVGVGTMRRGEKAVFTLKPEYGYGTSGSPPTIPPNATLVFEIELFDWRMEDLTKKKDGGVQRTILVEGSDYVTPNEGAAVTVRLVGKDGERVFEDREVSFVAGEASEANLVEGIDVAVSKMKKGETSRIVIRKDYAWGDLPPRSFELTPGADVTYEITLISFEKQKETWEMDEGEKLEQAESAKNRGSEFFRKEKYPLAVKQYKRVTQMLGPFVASERNEKKDSLLLAAYLNLAMTYLKQNKASAAIENCNLALEMDASNVKAYFRRGSANFALKEYAAARNDFEKVLSLEPNNAAARQEIIRTGKAIQELRQREKQIFAGMFDKFAQHDNEIERRRATNVWKELGDENKREFQSKEETPSE